MTNKELLFYFSLTQNDVAKKVNTHRKNVSLYMRGLYVNPFWEDRLDNFFNELRNKL